ncbi:MAG: ABC transporter ATP-binding protein [Clostridium sp.]|uniref:ABC transporter ATP-binding protein n=1 Tax=Clostridium TaxID=1485 RepID=UPI00215323DF|nr:ABC transporter ATP-binding protein [Clostridium sp. LY3-2]MCR6513884.1 ABC transporter ATP-binding protein [Clostridium sp. LY3-2]
MGIIKLEKVNKRYGEKVVLKDLSLEIDKGEMVALIGNSGKGKTTIMNIIGLLESFDSGKLIIDGEENISVNSKKANLNLRNKISYLFQNFALVENKTVSFNLEIATKYLKKSKSEKKALIEEALEKVNLKGLENKKVYQLSGGEQQRVSIARVLIKDSKIVLADEPTGSLDTLNRDMVFKHLKDMNSKGKTIVIVTHDLELAKMCDRIIKI